MGTKVVNGRRVELSGSDAAQRVSDNEAWESGRARREQEAADRSDLLTRIGSLESLPAHERDRTIAEALRLLMGVVE